MKWIVPLLVVAGIVTVVVIFASQGGTSGLGGVENACTDLLKAVQRKDRNAIQRYAHLSDPKAAEQLGDYFHSNDLVRFEILSSEGGDQSKIVKVHVVINPTRDSMVGKNTNQRITNMNLRFRWSSGRWALAGSKID